MPPSTTTPSPATVTGQTTSSIPASSSEGIASASQETTIPFTTTFTSSSHRCVATLEAQVLNDGATAVVMQNGSFVTLNNTCHTIPSTMSTHSFGASTSIFPSSSASSSSTPRPQSAIAPSTIAGLVIGVVAVLGCLIGFGFWVWFRRRRNNTTVFTAKAKMLEEDRSNEVPIRWETDSAEIKESDCAEIKEMSAGPLPVEMGDGRSIIEPNDTTPLSPISIDTRDPRDTLYGDEVEGIVSPLSPKEGLR